MKKLLSLALISSCIFADSFSIAPAVGFLKNNIGYGVNVVSSIDATKLDFKILGGDLEKVDVTAYHVVKNPYFEGYKLYVNYVRNEYDNEEKDNFYLGLFEIKSFSNVKLGLTTNFLLKAGIDVFHKDVGYNLGIGCSVDKVIYKQFYINSSLDFERYEYGNELTYSLGIKYNF